MIVDATNTTSVFVFKSPRGLFMDLLEEGVRQERIYFDNEIQAKSLLASALAQIHAIHEQERMPK